nr:YqcC family protein [Pseudomonas sp.]
MDPRIHALAEQLLLVERELRLQGMWSVARPSAEALASREPFCVDTLAFEQWLQWIFLPRMKSILENGEALPASSGILVMAEVVYREQPSMSGLLEALAAFDRLICGQS